MRSDGKRGHEADMEDDETPAPEPLKPRTETRISRDWRRAKEGFAILVEHFIEQVPVEPAASAELPPLALPPPPESEPPPAEKRRVGRPREHNWDAALQFAKEYYADKDLPNIKARVVEQMQEWFRTNDGPKAPDEHDIRKRVIEVLYRRN